MHLIQYALIIELLITSLSFIPLFFYPGYTISYILSPAAQSKYLTPSSFDSHTSAAPNPIVPLLARLLSMALLGILFLIVNAIPDRSVVTVPGVGSEYSIGDAVTRRKVAYASLGLVEVGMIGLFFWEGGKEDGQSVMNMQKAVLTAGNLASILAFRAWCFLVRPGVFEVGGEKGKKP